MKLILSIDKFDIRQVVLFLLTRISSHNIAFNSTLTSRSRCFSLSRNASSPFSAYATLLEESLLSFPNCLLFVEKLLFSPEIGGG